MRGLQSILYLLQKSLINSIVLEHGCNDIKVSLKSHFWCKNTNILPYICDVTVAIII